MTAAAVAVAAADCLLLDPAPLQLALQHAAVVGPRVVHLQVIQQIPKFLWEQHNPLLQSSESTTIRPL
jgi:hypothetical protein